MGKLLLLACLACLLAMHGAAAADRSRSRTLLLDVRINGHAIGMIGEFQAHGGRLHATRRELATLGLRTPPGPPGAEVPLGDLPGVQWRVDERAQAIAITAPSAALIPRQLGPDATAARAPQAPESAIGAVLNYDIDETTELSGHGGPRTLAEALVDARIFSPWGALESEIVATLGAGGGTRPLTRLDTDYSFADANSLRRYRVGDLISGGLNWTRPVRLGGVQVNTDLSIRPDLVTFPVPSITGEVAVPSSVDVLVNGVQVLSRDVPPGPFEIQQLPIVTGAGDIDVVTRDADGRQTRQTLPIYASSLLLVPGLQASSVELGSVRLNYGAPGDSYHGGTASFSLRRGILKWLTLETHAEGTLATRLPEGLHADSGVMMGGGASIGLGQLGAVSLDAAGSRFAHRQGGLGSATFERLGRVFNLAGSLQLATSGYRDVAGAFGDAPPRLQARASAGFPLGRFGSFGVAYVGLHRGPSFASRSQGLGSEPAVSSAFGLNALAAPRATRLSLVSASYSTAVFHGAAFVYASGFAELSGSGGDGALVGVTIPLGQRISVSAGMERDSDGLHANIGASQSANAIGDLGWRVLDQTGAPSRQMAIGEARTSFALVDAGVDRIAGQTAVRGSAQGALTFADGGLFASNAIRDSFAIVDTGEAHGVPILQENRPVGSTDSSGRLLVTDLRGLQDNRLDIDPGAVPVDSQIDRITRIVRPRDGSGVIVHFPIRSSHGAVLRLVDGAGTVISVGSTAILVGSTAKPAEIGFGGEAFVTGLQPHNTVVVKRPGGDSCRASFDYHAASHALPRIGPIACLAFAA